MRKLASLKKIDSIVPIEGADRIELATIGGWEVIVAKNIGHKEGDIVVYCEIDSFLPIEPEFEFLRKSSYKKMEDREGFRLRIVKLRGKYSCGLVLPLKEAMKIAQRNGYSTTHWGIGSDVSESLGIVKYEAPIPAQLSGKVKGEFPSFLRKTDEERVQNLSEEYESLKEKSYIATEKLDGSSTTYYLNNGEFGVCSRNWELSFDEKNSLWKVAKKLKVEEKLREYGKNICIQGELIGEGVQKNRYKIKGQTVKFFNGFDIDNQRRLTHDELTLLLESIDLPSVPFLGEFTLPDTVKELVSMAQGKSVLNSDAEREGIVIRSTDALVSFKAISNKFIEENE